jgi:hypothetical protein
VGRTVKCCNKHPNAPRVPRGGTEKGTRCKECLDARVRLRYWTKQKFSVRHAWNQARGAARRSGKVFVLTFDEFAKLVSQPCVYRIANDEASSRVGLDQRENSEGYTLLNAVPCCQLHNAIKSDIFSYEQMKDIAARYGIACGSRYVGRPRTRWEN